METFESAQTRLAADGITLTQIPNDPRAADLCRISTSNRFADYATVTTLADLPAAEVAVRRFLNA